MSDRRCDKCGSDCSYDGVQRSGVPGVPGYDCATCACGQTRQFELPKDPSKRIARCHQIAVGVARREDIPAGERARLVDDTLQEMEDAYSVLYAERVEPILTGPDAERLLSDLERICLPQEAERRIQAAKRWLRDIEVSPGERIEKKGQL